MSQSLPSEGREGAAVHLERLVYFCGIRDQVTDNFTIRGRHLSYQRSRHTVHPETSLIKIEGVDDTNAATYVSPKSVSRVEIGVVWLLTGCAAST